MCCLSPRSAVSPTAPQLHDRAAGARLQLLYTFSRTCRKAGVGSQLVADLLEERGRREVWLLTPKYRTNFYERCGFDVVAPWELPKCGPRCRASEHAPAHVRDENSDTLAMCVVC